MGQVIELDPSKSEEKILAKVNENRGWPGDAHIRYWHNRRQLLSWEEVHSFVAATHIPWKNGGFYLITGGAGKLGLIFAKEIASNTEKATLILTGRSHVNRKKQGQLKELESLGARIEYRQVNVSEEKEVEDLIQEIGREFGPINGVLHCAGLIRDNFILKKTVQEFQEVLPPKVAGTFFLDQATRDLELDFFVLFSSLAGGIGNAGQADYACANAFLDAYAAYRNTLVGNGRRHGRTLSINWPLWKEGGMQIDEATRAMMRKTTGIVAMETSVGLQAFYQALASGPSQVMVLEGDLPRLKQALLEQTSKIESHSVNTALSQIDEKILQKKILHRLKHLFGETIKLSVDRIAPREPLENYGIDSIMITQLNEKLAMIFGAISKTLFFECQTLASLAEYLIVDYPEACMAWTELESISSSCSEMSPAALVLNRRIPVLTSVKPRNRRRDCFSLQNPNNRLQESIAIIGISGHYPQSDTLDAYWELLKAGKDCIVEIPPDRWSLEGFFHPDMDEAVAQGKSYSKWGSFLGNFSHFDPLFFNISPREAMNMDPQERLFLQCSWEVLEDAGYTKEGLEEKFNRRVGVFAGITKTGFDLYGPELWKQGQHNHPHTSFSSVANRISYLFNLQGPSMPIDTMCSSSLTAIHEACEHIHRSECEMAIAGGVNLYLHPSTYVNLCAMNMLSRDGQCRSFGKGGNGFVPGEGVGVVLLKRLARAIPDGDHIYAVIRGSTVNHDGKTNGYTVPNPKAQAQLIRESLEKAGVNARTISYVEAHGTGTELGDPIEVTGLTQAFQKDSFDTGFCALGSAKSNLGHLEAAAGIAGLTKIVLQMKHGQLFPSLHSRELNSNIDFEKTPFVVQQDLKEWKRPILAIDGQTKEYSRIAGISSFGAGGSNAHVVIEEWMPPAKRREKKDEGGRIGEKHKRPALMVLSAKNEERLIEVVKNLHSYLTLNHEPGTLNLREVAYTLQIGREAMEERLAIMVNSPKELEEKLKGIIDGQNDIEDLYRGHVKQNKETFAIFTADEDMAKTVDTWIAKRKYTKLLELWVEGLSFNWNKLYGETKPHRISLPTYPFSKKRYWIPELTKLQSKISSRERLHQVVETRAELARRSEATGNLMSLPFDPLVHENTSNFSEEMFSSNLNSDKPKNVSLQPLSEDQFLSRKPESQSRESTSLSSADLSNLQAVVNRKSKHATHAHEAISAESLEKKLIASFAEVLYLKRSDVNVDKPFSVMGLDSIVGVEWIKEINKKYGLSLPATKLYDYPNIRELAVFLEKEFKKNGEIRTQKPLQQNLSISLNQLLQQVKNKKLDTQEADRLFQRMQIGNGCEL